MKVNMADLADIIGVSLPTIRSWLKKGLPYDQAGSNGKEWIFDTPNAIQWPGLARLTPCEADVRRRRRLRSHRRRRPD